LPDQTDLQAILDEKVNKDGHLANKILTTNAVGTIQYSEILPFKTMLGLDKVDNTSDLDKPVSSAQKNLIDKKMSIPIVAPNITYGIQQDPLDSTKVVWTAISNTQSVEVVQVLGYSEEDVISQKKVTEELLDRVKKSGHPEDKFLATDSLGVVHTVSLEDYALLKPSGFVPSKPYNLVLNASGVYEWVQDSSGSSLTVVDEHGIPSSETRVMSYVGTVSELSKRLMIPLLTDGNYLISVINGIYA